MANSLEKSGISMNSPEEINAFKPGKKFFIGIDSDGTAFDSMNIKHINSMLPAAIEVWNIEKGRAEFESGWKQLNLYSMSRGINRFPGLLHMLEQLHSINDNAFTIDLDPLRNFIEHGESLSNASLQAWINEHPDPLLDDVMRWSKKSDELFEEHTKGLLPFANVEAALALMAGQADIMVVSSAAGKGLDKDWSFSGLNRYVTLLAGQEIGSKKNQLQKAAAGKYAPHAILMIGDAPGDLEAARFVNALFFPVIPGKEEESWIQLREQSLFRFFNGTYQGAYEEQLIEKFLNCLK